jgi:hypothetical protein
MLADRACDGSDRLYAGDLRLASCTLAKAGPALVDDADGLVVSEDVDEARLRLVGEDG